MFSIHHQLQSAGYDSYVVWGRGRAPENDHEFNMGDSLGIKLHGVYTRLTDRTGFASIRSTTRLIDKMKVIQPDVIHLHNIHGYFINIELLFSYIKKNNIKVIWTLHDCWPFTGHCAYFDLIGCTKWKTGCYYCEQLDTYPASWRVDASRWNWKKKKELFTGADITIVAPCNWLKEKVSESFLREYPIRVINNGLDLAIYKPHVSDVRKRLTINDNFMILGVANEWTKRKGLNDFVLLEEKLRKVGVTNFKIVLVGLRESQVKRMPDSMIRMKRTENVSELLELYTTADVYFNPTYEDNYPTTNLEALSCGTPIITYRTGGSPESILPEIGVVFEQGAIDEVVSYLKNNFRAKMGFQIQADNYSELLDGRNMMDRYLQLYEEIKSKY